MLEEMEMPAVAIVVGYGVPLDQVERYAVGSLVLPRYQCSGTDGAE